MTIIDPVAIKALLQCSNVEELQQSAVEYEQYETEDPNLEEQLLKLQMLLWNRIMQLQKASGAPSSEMAVSLQAMGRLWLHMGDCPKAIGQLSKALELDAENGKTYELLSEAYSNSSDYENAIQYQEKAIPLLKGADKSMAYANLAGIHEAMCDFEQALSILQIAEAKLESDSDITAAEIWGRKGIIHEKMGDYKEAVEDLTKALALYTALKGEDDPKTQEISYLLEVSSGYV
jgi:tetratricopeptide (TPR) repeat protein